MPRARLRTPQAAGHRECGGGGVMGKRGGAAARVRAAPQPMPFCGRKRVVCLPFYWLKWSERPNILQLRDYPINRGESDIQSTNFVRFHATAWRIETLWSTGTVVTALLRLG